MDFLNLPSLEQNTVREVEHDYHIEATCKITSPSCPKCNSKEFVGFGRKRQLFKDTPFCGKRVGIWINRRRLRCKKCGRTIMEQLPDMDNHRQATSRLIQFIEKQSLCRTYASLADETGLGEKTIRNISHDYVTRLEKQTCIVNPRWLGIGEVNLINKSRCAISNIEKQTIVELLSNRNTTTVSSYLAALPNIDEIEMVAIDMWRPYRDAVANQMPHAQVIVDKFHVVRMADMAMEMIRKAVRAELSSKHRRELIHDRFVLLKRQNELSISEKIAFSTWSKNFPILGIAYKAKEAFIGLWGHNNRENTEKSYLKWVTALPSEIRSYFQPTITTVDKWHNEIFAYFDNPVTNDYTESLNSLTKVMNRLGRGYSFEALRAKILFTNGLQKIEKVNHHRQQAISKKCDYLMDTPTWEFCPTKQQSLNFGADIQTLVSKIESGEL